jgi:biopolymer transport protein ExbD
MTRTLLSDDALLGHALFVALATMAVSAVLGLGAYNESHERVGKGAARTIALPLLDARLAAKRAKPEPAPAEVLLFADGALAVNTRTVQPEKVVALFEEIRRTAVSVLIRCKADVPQGILLEVLAKARSAGLEDVRLEIEGTR